MDEYHSFDNSNMSTTTSIRIEIADNNANPVDKAGPLESPKQQRHTTLGYLGSEIFDSPKKLSSLLSSPLFDTVATSDNNINSIDYQMNGTSKLQKEKAERKRVLAIEETLTDHPIDCEEEEIRDLHDANGEKNLVAHRQQSKQKRGRFSAIADCYGGSEGGKAQNENDEKEKGEETIVKDKEDSGCNVARDKSGTNNINTHDVFDDHTTPSVLEIGRAHV